MVQVELAVLMVTMVQVVLQALTVLMALMVTMVQVVLQA
jgi:hypothetical protein